MTLRPYDPDQMDQLVLRMVSLCGRINRMSEVCRAAGIDDLPLNDKKALEWLGNLDFWVQKAEASMERHVTRHRGAQIAESIQKRKTSKK